MNANQNLKLNKALSETANIFEFKKYGPNTHWAKAGVFFRRYVDILALWWGHCALKMRRAVATNHLHIIRPLRRWVEIAIYLLIKAKNISWAQTMIYLYTKQQKCNTWIYIIISLNLLKIHTPSIRNDSEAWLEFKKTQYLGFKKKQLIKK